MANRKRSMMMPSTKLGAVLMVAALGISCASGNCRGQKKQTVDEVKKELDSGFKVSRDKIPEKLEKGRVVVYKADGSLQCGMGKGAGVDDMGKELGDVKILSRENKHDGLMHIQMCGAATGQINAYEIPEKDLEKAQKLGFRKLDF